MVDMFLTFLDSSNPPRQGATCLTFFSTVFFSTFCLIFFFFFFDLFFDFFELWSMVGFLIFFDVFSTCLFYYCFDFSI